MTAVLCGAALLIWGALPTSPAGEEEHDFGSHWGRDRASRVYIYEETPGAMLLVLDVFLAGIFLGTAVRTLQSHPLLQSGQREFLCRFAMLYGCYMLCMPLLVSLASGALSPWVREKWMRWIEQLAHGGALSALLWLLCAPPPPPPLIYCIYLTAPLPVHTSFGNLSAVWCGIGT